MDLLPRTDFGFAGAWLGFGGGRQVHLIEATVQELRRLIVLAASGRRLFDVRLRHQRDNGNGIGIAAAPSIADLNGYGRLEIVVSTIDHGIDVFRVPRSRANRRSWPTGRGSLLRDGAG